MNAATGAATVQATGTGNVTDARQPRRIADSHQPDGGRSRLGTPAPGMEIASSFCDPFRLAVPFSPAQAPLTPRHIPSTLRVVVGLLWFPCDVTPLMIIPYADRAVVDIRKLRDYCLNPLHDEGKHKAHGFAAALGMTASDAEALRDLLLQAVQTYDAHAGFLDAYGQRYTVDLLLNWRGRQALIRSGWIIEHGSTVPRLTSCYVF